MLCFHHTVSAAKQFLGSPIFSSAMERHRCKLCSKNFSNGRALGGHMRSHLLNLPICDQLPAHELELNSAYQQTDSASSSSDEEEEGEIKDQGYGLRENPKKSFRLADPEFSFAGSVVLQDRESESESSKNPTRRRSKRIRRSSPPVAYAATATPLLDASKRKIKLNSYELCNYRGEPEQGSSSISDATTEEDVAFCLMMLSRDKWKRQKHGKGEGKFGNLEMEEDGDEEDDHDEEEEETDESEEMLENCKVIAANKNSSISKNRGKYRCETCNKTFRSYQALGGHRASHKKAQMLPHLTAQVPSHAASAHPPVAAKGDSVKVHECPYCSRVFSSGQALGGHKRSHTTNYGASITVPIPAKKFAETLIDLNLPAPVEDDDLVELSAVSDAEYLYHTTR